ncbi:MAG: sulfotransferase [Acidimicrobiales bacterium]
MATRVTRRQRTFLRPPDPSRPTEWLRAYLSSSWQARRRPRLDDLECFCFFVGYARSGHSLVGSVLNAHPEIVISHELDALHFIERGFGRSQLFSLILRRDGDFGAMGRVWTGYEYTVPHQFQGRFERLRVIGDKKGGRTAYELGERPELLDRVRRTVGLPIRVIHVTRNPFDNIVAQASRLRWSIPVTIDWYERRCQAAAQSSMRLDPDELCVVPYEAFADDPRLWLSRLCSFVGVGVEESYLRDCASIVQASTSRRRHSIRWEAGERRRVDDLIERHDFLRRYSFEEADDRS